MSLTSFPEPCSGQVRGVIWELCDEYSRAEQLCLRPWCNLLGNVKRAQDPTLVANSQRPLQEVAEQLRRTCLADPERAEAERRATMRLQVEGQLRADAEVKAHRSRQERDAIRREWVAGRWRLVQSREAIGIGLGWPCRGERVTVTRWYEGGAAQSTARPEPGIYLGSHDTHNVSHLIWVLRISPSHQLGSRLVCWDPRVNGQNDPWGPADPAGDIAMRVEAAPARKLPVPLLCWPKVDDAGQIDPVMATPPGGQIALFDGPR